MIRSAYSFGTAVGIPEEVVARHAAIAGTRPAALADRNSTYGFTRWARLCAEHGIKPVFGVELGVSPDALAKKPAIDPMTLLAIASIAPINRLVGLATTQTKTAKSDPSLSYEQVNAIDRSGVVVIAGHRADLALLTPQPNTYVAAAPGATRGSLRQALARGFKLLARSNNLYPCEGDVHLYEAMLGGQASTQTYPQWMMSEDEWRAVMRTAGLDDAACQTARDHRDAVLDLCHATLPNGQMLTPNLPYSLRDVCQAGAQRLGIDLTDPTYAERLEHELSVIGDKRADAYLLLVADLLCWARSCMTVGPGRGSSSGSLVCFLSGITVVDPIKYSLIFERFIDLNRGGWRIRKDWNGFPGEPLLPSPLEPSP